MTSTVAQWFVMLSCIKIFYVLNSASVSRNHDMQWPSIMTNLTILQILGTDISFENDPIFMLLQNLSPLYCMDTGGASVTFLLYIQF